jgi:elongation factor Ts
MAISPKLVQELREKTGVGMMDCKRALEEVSGDLEEAVKVLRKKGIATAEKKSVRAASDGLVAALIAENGTAGVLLEVNCETDFVAKTDDFKDLVDQSSRLILSSAPADEAALMALPSPEDSSQTVKDMVVAKIAKLGENIQIRRFVRYEGQAGMISSYIHAGGKIGILLEAACESADVAGKTETQELLKDLCMQVAASAPRFVGRDEVTPEVLASEREIYRDQVLAQGKPANIVDKIVEGKMNKFFEENCLLEQPFIKDTGVKVQAHMDAVTGKALQVKRFTRFVLGEGLKSSSCGE